MSQKWVLESIEPANKIISEETSYDTKEAAENALHSAQKESARLGSMLAGYKYRIVEN